MNNPNKKLDLKKEDSKGQFISDKSLISIEQEIIKK